MPKTTWDTGSEIKGEIKVTFSEPVTNPVVLLSSLGGWQGEVTLTFTKEYLPLYKTDGIKILDRNRIQGKEGHAVLLIPGTFRELTIQADKPEYYNTINFGLRPNVTPIVFSNPELQCGLTSLTAAGGVAFEWSGGQTPKSASNSFSQTGTYALKATDKQGCVSYALTSITQVPPVEHKRITLQKKICAGETFAGYNTSGTYTDNFKTSTGCDSVRILSLVVQERAVSFTKHPSICPGQVILVEPTVGKVSAPLTYTWSTGETSPSIQVREPGRYNLTARNGQCLEKASIVVEELRNPLVLPDETVCLGKTIAAGSLESSVTYKWEPSGATTPEIAIQTEGVYRVVITNPMGCSVVRTLTVSGICASHVLAPTGFTPNGDGMNDVFAPMIVQGDVLELAIYDRWGALLYDERSDRPAWDGTYAGQACSNGQYTYRLVYRTVRNRSDQVYNGSIVLVR